MIFEFLNMEDHEYGWNDPLHMIQTVAERRSKAARAAWGTRCAFVNPLPFVKERDLTPTQRYNLVSGIFKGAPDKLTEESIIAEVEEIAQALVIGRTRPYSSYEIATGQDEADDMMIDALEGRLWTLARVLAHMSGDPLDDVIVEFQDRGEYWQAYREENYDDIYCEFYH